MMDEEKVETPFLLSGIIIRAYLKSIIFQ